MNSATACSRRPPSRLSGRRMSSRRSPVSGSLRLFTQQLACPAAKPARHKAPRRHSPNPHPSGWVIAEPSTEGFLTGGEIAYLRAPCPLLLRLWEQEAHQRMRDAFDEAFGGTPGGVAVRRLVVRAVPGSA